MGDGFVLLFWLIVLGAFTAAWMAAFGVYCFGRDNGSKTFRLLGGVPLIALTLIGIGCIGFVTFTWIRSTNPNYVFESQFHQPPTADVTNLRSSYWRSGVSEQVFLTFQTDPATFRRILPKNVRRIGFNDYRERMPLNGRETPPWWHPPTEATSEIYFVDWTKSMGESFYEETTLVTFEATTGTVMYFFLGID